MHLRTRIEYDSFVPSGSGPPRTQRELVEHRAMTRAYHLCALGFMLSNFDHANNPIELNSDDFSLAMQSYGLLIEAVAGGVFNDIDELLELSKTSETDSI